jgi:hypothetical protein
VVAEKMQKLQQGTAASVVAAVQPVQAKGGSKVVDAAVAVLTKAGKTMAASELFNEAVKSGLYVSDAKDPFTSFFSVLSKAVAKGEKRLVRLGSRTWSLAA